MSRRDMWAYNPDVCDGDFCPMNCDHCPKADEAEGYDEPDNLVYDEPVDLEMGFDPYLGCYTDDC
jgi:hypothetical protein